MKDKEIRFSYKRAEDASGFLLYKVYMRWHREIRRSLKELGITHTQFVLLASAHWLKLQNGEVTQIEIARHADMDVMMTSSVLRKLEEKKLLQRTPHSKDTRAKLISLTARGREVLAPAVKIVEDFDCRFFSKLKDSEVFNRELLRLLE